MQMQNFTSTIAWMIENYIYMRVEIVCFDRFGDEFRIVNSNSKLKFEHAVILMWLTMNTART